jgi:formyl-CoA transferase
VPRFDVFIENYGPGVVEKLDLTYERLRAAHPSIIYAQVKGFGTSGPYADYKSYDMIAQAAAGAFSVTGFPDDKPVCPGPTTGDSGTGMQLGMAVLAAYVQKLRTGEGQQIEISMQEAMTYFMRTRFSISGDWGNAVVPRTGNGLGPPTELYPCKPFGPNDWAYLICVTARHWDALCLAIERPDLITDERFQGLNRLQHADELYAEVAAWTKQHTKDEVMRHLGKAGVPCSAVLDSKDLYDDPHLVERGFVHALEHPQHGTVRLFGWAPRMSASLVPIERAPLLGEHTDEVLTGELGLETGEIASLRAAGVVR